MDNITADQLAKYLNEIITPANAQLTIKNVALTPPSFGEGVSRNFISSNNLPVETSTNVQHLFTLAAFFSAFTFGLPKEHYQNNEPCQVIFSSGSMTNYLRNLDTFINIIPAYMTNFLNITMEHLEGKASQNDFIMAANDFISFAQVVVILSSGADLEQPLLPADFGVPKISDKIMTICQKLTKCCQEGDKFRAMKVVNQPTDQQEEIFAKDIQELNNLVKQTRQDLQSYLKNIADHFDTLFTEPPYSDWQLYCKQIANAANIIAMVSYEIATNDPTSFTVVIQVLNQFLTKALLMTAPILSLLRFRGDFEASIKKSKEAHGQLTAIMKPLLEAVIRIMPKCPKPLSVSCNAIIVAQFQELQRLHSQYLQNLDTLIANMKTDRKFATFNTVGAKVNSEASEAAKGSLDAIMKIINQLLKQNAPAEEVAATLPSLTTEIDSFNKKIIDIINKEPNLDAKVRALQIRDSITTALTEFVQNFQIFTASPTNDIIRNNTGLSTVNLLLAFCHLDTTQSILKNLSLLRPILSDNLVQLVPNNFKTILEVLALIHSKSNELTPTARDTYLPIFTAFVSEAREAASIFAANSNPNNPNNVTTCMHECDKLQTLLTAMIQCLTSDEVPADLNGPLQLLRLFQSNIKNASELFRLTMQSHISHLGQLFIEKLTPFAEIATNLSSKQSEEQYERFKLIKAEIGMLSSQIINQLKNLPAHAVFNFDYISQLRCSLLSIIQPTATIATETKEVLKIASDPAPIKAAMNEVTVALNSLTDILRYIDNLYYDKTLPIPSLFGPLLQNSFNNMEAALKALATALQSNQQGASQPGLDLVNRVHDLANTMAYLDQLAPVASPLKPLADGIGIHAGRVALGDTTDMPSLVKSLQSLQTISDSLKPIIEQYNAKLLETGMQAQEDLKKASKPVDPNVPIFPKGDGLLLNPQTGERYQGLLIDRIPDAATIDKMFMEAMQHPNEQMRGLLTSYLNQIKKDVDEFLPLFAEYQRNPSPELIARLNVLGSRIVNNLKAYNECLNFNSEEAKPENLETLSKEFREMPNSSKALAAPEMILNMSALANKLFKDPQQQAQFNGCLAEVIKNLTDNPELAFKQIDLLSQALLSQDPSEFISECVKVLRENLKKRDASETALSAEALVFADRLGKILANAADPMPRPGSVQEKMLQKAQEIREQDQITDPAYNEIIQLVNQFEDSLAGESDDTQENENDIPDKIMDLTNRITELGLSINNEFKKPQPDLALLMKDYNEIKESSLEIGSMTTRMASRRPEIEKDLNADLEEGIVKLFDSIAAFEESIKQASSGGNRTAQRAVNKNSMNLTGTLNSLSDIADQLLETSPSTLEPSENDYNAFGNIIQNDLLKLSRLLHEVDSSDKKGNPFLNKRFAKIATPLQQDVAKFRHAVETASHGTDESDELIHMLDDLENLLKPNVTDHNSCDKNLPSEASKLLREIRNAVADALSTEVVSQPNAVAQLPFRYNAPVIENCEPKPTAELLGPIEQEAAKAQQALQELTANLNNAKTTPDKIQSALNKFHESLTNLIKPTDRMAQSTWNPQCQNALNQTRNLLISSGDLSIDASRSRLLGSDGWRDVVSAFGSNATESINRTIQAAKNTVEAAQHDLSVTNEAERELVKAAQSVAQSHQRLQAMKVVAAEKKIANGEGYLGCDIIEISAPILSTSAKLIETAQAQTRFLLNRGGEMPNTKGLVKTANDLVDSLTLITVAAECTVNNEPDCISKVLAASNLVSSAVQHFLAEMYQKNGNPELDEAMKKITDSILGLVKQLRSFGEVAHNAQNERLVVDSQVSGAKLSSMIQKLNAEAKVVEARRALEEAELKLKKTRQQNK